MFFIPPLSICDPIKIFHSCKSFSTKKKSYSFFRVKKQGVSWGGSVIDGKKKNGLFLNFKLLGKGNTCCVHNMIGLKQTNLKALWRNRLVRSVPIPKVRSSIPGICGTFGKNTKIPFSTKILFEIIYTKL